MSWDKLSMAEKAEIMRLAVQDGIYNLDAIRNGYNEYAKGGKIHIAPSKRGTFTAAASKHGKSVQAFASQVLAHPENYSPAMRKKANFARNAAKWKHGFGGNLFDGTTEGSQQMQVSPYRYVLDDEGSWNRVANDEIGRVFQGLTVTPRKTKQKFIPERIDNSLEAAKARKKFFQYRDEEGHIKGEPGLEIVSPEFDALALAPLAIQGVKTLGTGTKKIAAEIAEKINPRGIISDNDAHVLAADAKYAIKKYINSKQERDRIKAALKRNNENGSHADWEVAEMNSNLNDSRLTLEPQVYSDGKPVHGVTIKDGRNIDVKLTTNRESPDDLLFTGEHEYGHVTETDKILELLKKEWGDLKVNPEYYMVNGVEDPVLKAYYTGIPENRSMSLAVQADMYDRGFSSLGKYLEYLSNNKMMNEQWLKLKSLHGEEKAKKLVESVFGISPLIYIGKNNQ